MKKQVHILLDGVESVAKKSLLQVAVCLMLLLLLQACGTSRRGHYTAVPSNKSDTATAKNNKSKNKKVSPDENDEPFFGDDDEYDWFEEMEDLDRDR